MCLSLYMYLYKFMYYIYIYICIYTIINIYMYIVSTLDHRHHCVFISGLSPPIVRIWYWNCIPQFKSQGCYYSRVGILWWLTSPPDLAMLIFATGCWKRPDLTHVPHIISIHASCSPESRCFFIEFMGVLVESIICEVSM